MQVRTRRAERVRREREHPVIGKVVLAAVGAIMSLCTLIVIVALFVPEPPPPEPEIRTMYLTDTTTVTAPNPVTVTETTTVTAPASVESAPGTTDYDAPDYDAPNVDGPDSWRELSKPWRW